MFKQQKSGVPARDRSQNSLYGPSQDLLESKGQEGHVFKTSVYTKAAMHPKTTMAVLLGLSGMALAAWMRTRQGGASAALSSH
jgi:hypothetical protein